MANKDNSPIYLSSTRLERIFDILSTRNLSHIDRDYLNGLGFTNADASLAITGLKFLKILNDNGEISKDIQVKFQLKGDPKTQALKTIIEDAYAEFFNRVPKPFELSKVDLHNEFKTTYKLSPRLTQSAIPTFKWLCELVGLKDDPRSAERPTKKILIEKKIKPTASFRKENCENNNHDFYIFKSEKGIELKVPMEKDYIREVIAYGNLKEIVEAIKAFEKQYINDAENEKE